MINEKKLDQRNEWYKLYEQMKRDYFDHKRLKEKLTKETIDFIDLTKSEQNASEKFLESSKACLEYVESSN